MAAVRVAVLGYDADARAREPRPDDARRAARCGSATARAGRRGSRSGRSSAGTTTRSSARWRRTRPGADAWLSASGGGVMVAALCDADGRRLLRDAGRGPVGRGAGRSPLRRAAPGCRAPSVLALVSPRGLVEARWGLEARRGWRVLKRRSRPCASGAGARARPYSAAWAAFDLPCRRGLAGGNAACAAGGRVTWSKAATGTPKKTTWLYAYGVDSRRCGGASCGRTGLSMGLSVVRQHRRAQRALASSRKRRWDDTAGHTQLVQAQLGHGPVSLRARGGVTDP